MESLISLKFLADKMIPKAIMLPIPAKNVLDI